MMLLEDPAGAVALFVGIMSGATMLLVVFAFSGGTPRRLRRRIVKISAQSARLTVRSGIGPSGNAGPKRSLSRRRSTNRGLERLLRLLPRRAALIERIERTGRGITIAEYAVVTIGAIAGVSLLAMFFAGLGWLASVLLGLALGLSIPHYIVGRMGRKRVARFIALFPEAVDLIVRALRAGLPITEAIIGAGREIGDPVGTELRGIEAGMQVGRDLDTLLWDIAKRITAPEFRFFIIALTVQRETGGNLAETLNNLSEVLRRRRAMRAKVRAMASEARASTVILGSLPNFVTLIMSVTSPAYIAPLFTDIRGLMMLGLALCMLLTGIGIMVKMARFEI
jgi:tight adherence protein B